MKQKEMDNRGLSLVELLVTVAILSVVLIAVFGFVIFSSNQYHKGNREANLSNEAQMLVARIENLILNASYVTVTDGGNELAVYEYMSEKQYQYTHIYLDSNQTLLYEVSYLNKQGDDTWSWDDEAAEELSTYVTGMTLDASKLDSDRALTVTLDMALKDKSYTTGNTFIFRNKVKTIESKIAFKNAIENGG